MGHLKVTIGYLRATVCHLWATVGHLRATIFTISEQQANTTELHPKVRPTCYQIFFPTITNKNSQHQIILSGENLCAEWGSQIKLLFSELYLRTNRGKIGRHAADVSLHPSDITNACIGLFTVHCCILIVGACLIILMPWQTHTPRHVLYRPSQQAGIRSSSCS